MRTRYTPPDRLEDKRVVGVAMILGNIKDSAKELLLEVNAIQVFSSFKLKNRIDSYIVLPNLGHITEQAYVEILNYLQDQGAIEELILLTPNRDGNDYMVTIIPEKFNDFYQKVFVLAIPYIESGLRGLDNELASTPHTKVLAEKDSAIHTALLSFDSITKPVIKINEEQFTFKEMRDGKPFNIISYCLEHYPKQHVTLIELKAELKASGVNVRGLVNLREAIRNSLFGEKHELSIFVIVSPHSIIVKPSIPISDKQFEMIKKSKKLIIA
jgi:hypothetical protein